MEFDGDVEGGGGGGMGIQQREERRKQNCHRSNIEEIIERGIRGRDRIERTRHRWKEKDKCRRRGEKSNYCKVTG